MSWSTPFEDPIPLPDGGQLVTLNDAGEYIQSFAEGDAEDRAMADREPSMFARIGMMQALYPQGEQVFNKSRKDPHWGKRKLKRDQ